MTEHEPEHHQPTTPAGDTDPPTRRRNTRLLILTGLAAIVLIAASAVGGYLIGHNNQPDNQRDASAATFHLTKSRHTLAQQRADLDKIINRLNARYHRLQAQHRILIIRISKQGAVHPRL